MRHSESKETVLLRSSGESLQWVPKVQGEKSPNLSGKRTEASDNINTFIMFCLHYILFRATDTVGDFFISKKQKRKAQKKWT